MRHTPRFLMTDPDEVKRLVRAYPWATFVSGTSRGLVASHYPVLLDEDADGIVILSHVGRPDDELHELGRYEMLVIVQGPHDYSPPAGTHRATSSRRGTTSPRTCTGRRRSSTTRRTTPS